MPKEYTDYILLIMGSGQRVYHLVHLWKRKGNDFNGKLYPHNENKYILDLDRAYRIRWAPWSKIIRETLKVKVKEKGGVEKIVVKSRILWGKTLSELLRSKKIGLLIYQEPCDHRCSRCSHKECDKMPAKVEPMHISRIHQPSGVMKG